MLTVAISSRSLFKMEDCNAVFQEHGQVAFDQFMRESESTPLECGVAFDLVKKLLRLNTAGGERRVDIVLLSLSSPESGGRLVRSIKHHGLDIHKAVFTRGADRIRYAKAMKVDLFLCASEDDAKAALDAGIAAAVVSPNASPDFQPDEMLRIIFDGDSVLFSDESDKVYREQGLAGFHQHEEDHRERPLAAGPFHALFCKLHELQAALRETSAPALLHIGLLTARGTHAHARVMTTFRSWGVSVDEAVFSDGAPKGPLLKAMSADFFFDDTHKHVACATSSAIAAARVPYGAGGIVRAVA